MKTFTHIVGVVLGLCLSGPVIAAPPPRADELLVKRALPEALAESKAQNKLLLVEIAGNTDRQRRALADYQPAPIRRWVARHALAVLLTDTDTIRKLSESDLNPGPDADPLVFRAGLQVRVFGSGLPQKQSRLKGPGKPGEAFLGLGFKLDWTLRGREDPVEAAPQEPEDEYA